jgi:hypothetical protein
VYDRQDMVQSRACIGMQGADWGNIVSVFHNSEQENQSNQGNRQERVKEENLLETVDMLGTSKDDKADIMHKLTSV